MAEEKIEQPNKEKAYRKVLNKFELRAIALGNCLKSHSGKADCSEQASEDCYLKHELSMRKNLPIRACRQM
jgi:hypothetical protein